MKTTSFFGFIITIIILTGCSASRKMKKAETPASPEVKSVVVINKKVPERLIDTKNVSPEDVIAFAETLIGIKYKYGSMDKQKGFDCSGFINYVFNHFNISVPRVSVDFTNAGEEVSLKDSKPGDIILFTGSDAKSGIVGHMGLITENKNGDVKFIHASESRGVIISGMNSYFIPRFVKVNRVFDQLTNKPIN
ncbi:MAG TPA: C40 family peptidase [Hanamia sp.]|nr:C40 family peptidase [Hanamia sp.]